MFKKLNKEDLLKSINRDNQQLESIIKTLEKENKKLRLKIKKKEIILEEVQNYIK